MRLISRARFRVAIAVMLKESADKALLKDVMSKFTFHGHVTRDRIGSVLPAQYRGPARAVMRPDVKYVVLLFGLERGDVVTSGPVRKALRKVPTEEAILAVGANFTEEALALLAEWADSAVVRLGDFYWTDSSYASVRE